MVRACTTCIIDGVNGRVTGNSPIWLFWSPWREWPVQACLQRSRSYEDRLAATLSHKMKSWGHICGGPSDGAAWEEYAARMLSCYSRSMSSWGYQDRMVSQWPCYSEANGLVVLQPMITEQQGLIITRLWCCRPTADAGMIKWTLLLTAKILGKFYFVKNTNTLAPQWHEISTKAIC